MVDSSPHDRAHDYGYLIRRWRGAARRAGLKMTTYATAGGYDLVYLQSTRPPDTAAAIYLSAGIHGDEAGATEGLRNWVEKEGAALRDLNLLIFPCLNPWGLVNNTRLDAKGRDLNRGYRLARIPQLAAQMRILAGRRFHLALTLHEDYDARGNYLYEVVSRRPYWGEKILAAESRIPVDPRRRIDDRSARKGVLRARLTPDLMPGWPEAFVLHFTYAERTLTIETPSEFSIGERAAAQQRMIARAVRLVRKEAAELRKKSPPDRGRGG